METRTDENPVKQSQTWSVQQLAVMLHVSVRKIYQAIENGQLIAEKSGKSHTISHEAISEFLKQGNPFIQA